MEIPVALCSVTPPIWIAAVPVVAVTTSSCRRFRHVNQEAIALDQLTFPSAGLSEHAHQ